MRGLYLGICIIVFCAFGCAGDPPKPPPNGPATADATEKTKDKQEEDGVSPDEFSVPQEEIVASATLAGLPDLTSTATTLDVTVSGALLTEYQFALLFDGTLECKEEDYSDWRTLGEHIVVSELGQPGTKVLCVKGRTAEKREQETPTIYQWTLVSVASNNLVSIVIEPPRPTLAAGTASPVTATAFYGDGSTADVTDLVEWQLEDQAVASVAMIENVPTIRGGVAGVTKLIASLDDVSTEIDVTITNALLRSLSVSPQSVSLAAGTSTQLSVMGTFSDNTTQDLTLEATWDSSNPAVATVSDIGQTKGLVTASSATGATIVRASYDGKTSSAAVNVTSAVITSLAIAPTNPSLTVGTRLQLTATATLSDQSTQTVTGSVNWTVLDSAIVSVNNAGVRKGEVQGNALGSTIVSAAIGGITASVTVSANAAVLTSITVSPAGARIIVGETQAFTALGSYNNGTTQDLTSTALWSSSDNAKAVVGNAAATKGVVTGLAAGAISISATQSGVTGSRTADIDPIVPVSVSLSPATASVPAGDAVTFSATATFNNGTVSGIAELCTWSSSIPGSAAADPAVKGRFTTLAPGTVAVTATCPNGVLGTATLTVLNAALLSLSVAPSNPAVALGESIQITAMGMYTDGVARDVTSLALWTSADTAVATVSNEAGSVGLTGSVAVGATQVSATLDGKIAATTITVGTAELLALEVAPATVQIITLETTALTAFGHYTDGSIIDVTDTVTWLSTDETIASVSAMGVVTAGTTLSTVVISATIAGPNGPLTDISLVTVVEPAPEP